MAHRRSRLLSFAGSFVALATAASLPALDWTVDISADENDGTCAIGDCSLREAIAAAGDGDSVLFALPGSPPWLITLDDALGELSLANDITIVGPGAGAIGISGGGLLRLMTVQAGATVTLSGLTLRNGEAKSSGDKHGGCVKVLGTLTASATTFFSCQAWKGGLTSNTPGGDGGAIFVAAGGTFVGQGISIEQGFAGVGGGALSPPTVFAGGRGGGIANAGAVRLIDSTVTQCRAGNGGGPTGPGGDGGGISNLTGGVLRIDGTSLYSNRSGDGATFMGSDGADGRGGAIFCAGDCTLNNVSLVGNVIGSTSAGLAAQGGGLFVSGGTTRLRNVTVADNTATSTGGGIARSAGTIRTRNSIFSGNLGGGSPDCASATAGVVSEGFNLIRINNGCAASFAGTDQEGTSGSPLNPLLGLFTTNGGPTPTYSLQTGSPAIDHGDSAGCLKWNPQTAADEPMTTDQRGFLRPTDGDGDATATCDVGAYEAAAVPVVQHLLTASVSGAGAGSVASTPSGIVCPGDCTESYAATQSVDLTATPDAGSYFIGWSGDCTGTLGCSVMMSADRNVTATFGLLRTLDVTLSSVSGGTGSVASSPNGISCPGDCSEAYPDGTPVTLTATPSPGSTFVGWTGACSGTGACQPTLDANRSVTATFSSPTIFVDGFGSGDECVWSANVGGSLCPP